MDWTQVRQRLEAQEARLSPFAVRSSGSRGRSRPEEPSPLRTEFQRDRDRILHTNAFRRLKHKTQVFLAPLGDHYVTRLTHTLEVAQIARTIARALNLNEDLTEAIALGHDLGHTPFGHTGERVLNRLLPGGFRHAEQSLRVVDRLEKGGQGLNLTWEVRQGILAHSKPRGRFLESGDRALSLEAQVVRLADAVAYVNHDLEDALRAGVLREEDLPPEPLRLLGRRHSERVNAMVCDIVEASWPATGEAPIPEGEAPTIRMSPRMESALVALREFLFERVYLPLSASPEAKKAEEIVELLFFHFVRHPEEVPEDYRHPGEPPERWSADYVAGMTDRFALRMAEALRPGIAEGIPFRGL